jgi:hypothetical protein
VKVKKMTIHKIERKIERKNSKIYFKLKFERLGKYLTKISGQEGKEMKNKITIPKIVKKKIKT